MRDESLNPDSLLFVRKQLETQDVQGLSPSLYGPGDHDLRTANITLLLPLFHEARAKDSKIFLIKAFLPWVSLQRSTQVHRERILDEFVRSRDFEVASREELVHLVNIYRSLVADLLDPYLTLVVACFRFVEGSFVDIEDANFGQDERNKAEYLESRIKKIDPEGRLLGGYEPIVRNAVSHAGSHGVSYEPDGVLFRSIKRGRSPKVAAVKWSRDTLLTRITQLYECVLSIDAAVNVFGVDCGEFLLEEDVKSQLIQLAFTSDQRSELRTRSEEMVERVRNDKTITPERRLNLLSEILFYNYARRQMPVLGIRANTAKRILLVEIPNRQEDLSNDTILGDAVMDCCRYTILANAVFGTSFDEYATAAVLESGRYRLTIILLGTLLKDYGEEKAGLLDLLHKAEVRVDGGKVVVAVDFERVEQLERENLGRTFPRRPRPPGQ